VVAAWDGEFGNKTNVEITVINVNDMKPKFEKEKYVVKEEEERVPQYPIFQVNDAYMNAQIENNVKCKADNYLFIGQGNRSRHR